jgi:hypothetical protein
MPAPSLDLNDLFRGFTNREREFCFHYIGAANFNQTKAADMAGYATPPSEAARLMKREHIVNAIGSLLAQRTLDLTIDAKWVLVELIEVQRDAKAKGNRKDNLRALELIGKHVDVAAFREQHGLGGLNGEPLEAEHDLSHLTDEELDQLEAISRKIYARKQAADALPNLSSVVDSAGAGSPEA